MIENEMDLVSHIEISVKDHKSEAHDQYGLEVQSRLTVLIHRSSPSTP